MIELPIGIQWVLKESRHKKDMKMNHISKTKLYSNNYTILYGNYAWKVTKGSMVVARGKMVVLYLFIDTSK